MTIRTSNSLYLAILDPVPRERLGWWVDVHDAINPATLLARIDRFAELTFLDPQSDVGYGTISLLRDDPVLSETLPNGLPASRLLDYPNYFRVIDNGVERFRFFYEGRSRTRDNGAVVKLEGQGRAAELAFGTILPAQWPTQTKAVVRKYVQRSWAYVFLELLDEAKDRGAIPSDVTPTFTATQDSLGQPWTDLADYEVPVGGDLLSLIQQWKESAGFEWHMNHRGELAAATDLGFNRAASVRFYEGVNVITAEDAEDLSGLRTDVYAQAQSGTIAKALSPGAAAKYRRRETFLTASADGNISATNLTVNGALKILQKPITSRTFKVPIEMPDADGLDYRRAFVDYGVSDLIGYGPRLGDGSSDYRVVSMAVKVDKDGADLEVTIQSKREQLIARLNRILSRQLGGSFSPSSSSTSITGVIKQAINGTITLGDLTDVDLSGATDGMSIFYDALAGEWIAANPGGSGSINDLDDVDTTGKTVGDTLVWDGTNWVPDTPSAGGDSTQGDRRWTLPGSWTLIDDFADAALDGAWVRVDGTGAPVGNVTWSEAAGVLSLRHTGADSAAAFHALMRPISGALAVGDAFITALQLFGNPTGYYTIGGIMLANGITHGAGSQVLTLSFCQSPGQNNNVRSFTGYNSQVAEASVNVTPFGVLTFVRLVYVATNTWRMDTSPDGVQWIKGATITYTMTPTHVGLHTSSWGGTIESVTNYHFLARTSGVT